MEGMTIPPQSQDRQPGLATKLDPPAEHIRASYKGSGKLAGKRTVITGGDSGIGRAVALHFAREGADVAVLYLDEHEDAETTTAKLVEHEGVRCITVAGDIADSAFCSQAIAQVVEKLGGSDVAPMKRIGQPSEMGPACVYLACEDLSFVAGQTIHASDGMIING